jgi:hypothetical protein
VDENQRSARFERRVFVARFGHCRIERLWLRDDPPADGRGAKVRHSVVFEVDDSGEFDLGWLYTRTSHLPSGPRESMRSLAALWRRAHSPPPADRPPAVQYYVRRLGPGDMAPEEWQRDGAYRMPGCPTIAVDAAAALIEGALHELQAADTHAGQGTGADGGQGEARQR